MVHVVSGVCRLSCRWGLCVCVIEGQQCIGVRVLAVVQAGLSAGHRWFMVVLRSVKTTDGAQSKRVNDLTFEFVIPDRLFHGGLLRTSWKRPLR